ncbi:MAG: response regulator [Acidobacteriota bacterium]
MTYHKTRILCVEDNKDSRDVLKRLLESSDESYQVTAVETAAEALALDARGSYDLYILDIWLPGMDGVDLCRRLRDRGRKAPVMFYSAMGVQPSDRDYVLAAGANAFLVKSVDIDRLIPTVVSLLSEYSATADPTTQAPLSPAS